ncbi:MAG: DUF4115 domain-containing protein [Methylotenera sp.]|nr:DUF4115 domain-containing protein [Methylotenera sp.]
MTDELIASPVILESVDFPPLGEVLLSARVAKKLSLKDVSNNLRLSVGQIEALESNDFVVLPQPMITRGFIRNYARLLEVDVEPLLESYRARMPETLPSGLRVQTSINQVMLGKKSQPLLKYFLVSLLILLSVLFWFLYSDYQTKLQKQSAKIEADVASKNVDAGIAPLPEIALPAAERNAESFDAISPDVVAVDNAQSMPNEAVAGIATAITPTQSTPLRPSTDVDFNTLKEGSAKTSVPDLIATKPYQAAVTEASGEIVARKNVSLSVSEETWVQITDKSGTVIYEKMLAANTQDGFDGQPPFKVWIGNAKATTLMFLGQPVDLVSKTKNNVARVTLE